MVSCETVKHEGGVKYPPLLVLLVKVKYYFKIHKVTIVGGKNYTTHSKFCQA